MAFDTFANRFDFASDLGRDKDLLEQGNCFRFVHFWSVS